MNKSRNFFRNLESLILAQNERWRYALYMQVERFFFNSGERMSNA